MSQQPSTTFRWVDLIRVIGSFLVVMAHLHYTAAEGTYIYHFYYALSRIAVPLFFLVSGFLLLSKQEPIGDFFKKRAWKIFFPFIIWSLIYMALAGVFSESMPWLELLQRTVMSVIRSPRADHLWFLYALMGLYLATPVLRLFVANAKDSDLLYFIAVWIIAVPVTDFFADYTRLRVGIEWKMFTGYIGYFVLGYYLGRREYTRLQLGLIAAACIFSLGFTWAGIHVAKHTDPYVDYFETYLSLNVIVMAATGFVLLSRVPVSDAWQRFIAPQSRASFGIYLIHILVLGRMMVVSPFKELYQNAAAIWVMPLLTLVAYAVSFALTFLLQKIPFVRSIVP